MNTRYIMIMNMSTHELQQTNLRGGQPGGLRKDQQDDQLGSLQVSRARNQAASLLAALRRKRRNRRGTRL